MIAALQTLNAKSVRLGFPFNITFELTPRCNLRCGTCYIHRPDCLPEQLDLRPAEFWLAIARQAMALGSLVLVITGGEVFLYPRVERLIEQLNAMGFLLSLNTNGTLLDQRCLDWLAELRPAKVNISLYGASNETYRRLCGCENGFDRVARAIDGLLERGLNVYLNGTLTPENVGDLEAMAAFAKARKLLLHNTAYLFPAGRYGIHSCPGRLSPEQAAEATLKLELLQYGPEQTLRRCLARRMTLADHLAGRQVPVGGFAGGTSDCGRANCLGGRNSFAVSWDAVLLPCVSNAGVRVPLEGRALSTAWEELKARVASLPLPKACDSCPVGPICNVCAAGLYSETGRFDRLAPYPCAYVHAAAAAEARFLAANGIEVKGCDGNLV